MLLLKGYSTNFLQLGLSTIDRSPLAVYCKDNLIGILSDFFGHLEMNKLKTDNHFEFQGVTIHLITEKIPSSLVKGPILACHTNLEFIHVLSKDDRATDIVYVPWMDEELSAYKTMYKSTEIVFEENSQRN